MARLLCSIRGSVHQLIWPLAAALVVFVAGCQRSVSDPAAANNARENAAERDSYGGSHRRSIDPVALNGPIFEGWERPKLAIVITGEQDGYLEPCGCAGLDNQKGGLGRRHALLDELRTKRGWPVVAIDLGGQIRRYGPQADMKFRYAADALRAMGYGAVALGLADLRLGADTILLAATAPDGTPTNFVSANVKLAGFDEASLPLVQRVEVGETIVGITSILGVSFHPQLDNPDVTTSSPEDALAAVLPQLTDSDFRVLLAHASREESRALAERFTEFDIVVTAGGADEPPREAARIDGTNRLLVEIGHKGMYAAVVGLYDEPPPRYQRVPLDARFHETAAMKKIMTDYQAELRAAGFDALVPQPTPHPRAQGAGDPAGQFVGAERCGKCHTKAHATWKKVAHSHATDTLTKLSPPRQFDPECISCHATGWNPQEYFRYETGFESLERTPLLAGNGCENCHGPGGAHATAEEARPARDLVRRDQLRAAMRLTKSLAEDQHCVRCHDHDNSPEFNFTRYWPNVEHRGMD